MDRMILPLMLFVVACQPAAMELTEEQTATIKSELDAVADEAIAAIAAVDIDRHLQFYVASEDLTVAMQGEVIRSFATWADGVRAAFSGIESIESCAFTDKVTQVLSADVAVFTADFGCTGTTTGGGPLVFDHTVTAVMQKQDGVWKCVNFSETYPPPDPSSEQS